MYHLQVNEEILDKVISGELSHDDTSIIEEIGKKNMGILREFYPRENNLIFSTLLQKKMLQYKKTHF